MRSLALPTFIAFLLLSIAYSTEIKEEEEYVQTPFGLMLKDCVTEVPHNTHIYHHKESGTIHLNNEDKNFTKIVSQNERCKHRNPTALLGQWLDNGGYYLPSGSTLKKFEANYLVPQTPLTTGDQWLYYFIGTQNNDGSGSSLTILQPVLAYHNGWYFQSWNCCPDGQAINSPQVFNVNPGDIIYGSIEVGDSKVEVISENSQGQQSGLRVDKAGRNFNWIDATLEIYYVDQCTEYPNGYLEYSNMKVTLNNDQQIDPQWYPTGATECDGFIQILSPSDIRIYHNGYSSQQAQTE